MRRAATTGAVLALLATAGCGEDDTAKDIRSATGATTGAPAAGDELAANAVRARDRLLDIARQTVQGKPGQTTNPRLLLDAWQATGFAPVAPVEAARPGTVSPRPALNFFPTANDKQVPGPNNPFEYWFVVSDSSGQCHGGVLRGYPNITEFFPFSPPLPRGRCAGARVDRSQLGR
jgi:hypothetical protein